MGITPAAGTMYDLVRIEGQMFLYPRGTAEVGQLVCVMTDEEVVEWGWGEDG